MKQMNFHYGSGKTPVYFSVVDELSNLRLKDTSDKSIKVLLNVERILLKMYQDHEERKVLDEMEVKWKRAAIVLDRLFLFLTLIYFVITFISFVMPFKNFYKPT